MAEYGNQGGIMLLEEDNASLLGNSLTHTLTPGQTLNVRTGEDPAYPIPVWPVALPQPPGKMYNLRVSGEVDITNTDASWSAEVQDGYVVPDSRVTDGDGVLHNVPATRPFACKTLTELTNNLIQIKILNNTLYR